MLIRRSELDGTRVLEIDRLVQRGARGPSGRSVRFLTDPDDAQVALHSPVFDRQRLARSFVGDGILFSCLLYTSPSPRDRTRSRMPSSA